jgi:hypothetical protein
MAIQIVSKAKKPLSKPQAKPATENNATPGTPAIVQHATQQQIPAEMAKRLAALEKDLAAEKAANVKLQEAMAKSKQDKNAWKNEIYSLDKISEMASGKGDAPISNDDWRLPYHEQFIWGLTYDVKPDGSVVPRTDLPVRQILCLIPASGMPLEPGEDASYMRTQRRDGFLALYEDFSYDESGNISGVRGAPRQIPESAFASIFVAPFGDADDAAPEETEATPEPPPVVPAKPAKATKTK